MNNTNDITATLVAVKDAELQLLSLSDAAICEVLSDIADAAEQNMTFLLEANREDLNRMDPDNPKYDRLKLTPERIAGIANGIRKVANLPSPLHKVLRVAQRTQDRTRECALRCDWHHL